MSQFPSRRSPAMDIIRCFALFCVISVHFFFNSGFYDQPVTGLAMGAMTVLRSFFLICVPLFLLLSGYLLGSKRPDKAYFMKVFRTLGIYILACFACNLFRILRGEPVSVAGLLATVLNFTAAPYAWYVEMYLGLFFLIPFLNVLYDGLDAKSRHTLLLCLLLLTALPGMLNIHNLTSVSFWKDPASVNEYHQLIPGWWTGCYPVTCYILGRYLKENKRKISTSANLALIGAAALLFGLFSLYRSRNVPLVLGAWQDYGSLPVILLAVLTFRLLENFRYNGLSAGVCRLISRLSGWTLGAYLVSWIFDQIFYPMLAAAVPSLTDRFLWFLPVVLAVYLCSMALSAVLNAIYDLAAALLEKLSRGSIRI